MAWQDEAPKEFIVGKGYYYCDSGLNVYVHLHCCSRGGDEVEFQVMVKDSFGNYQPSGARFSRHASKDFHGVESVRVFDVDEMHPKVVNMSAFDRWGKLNDF